MQRSFLTLALALGFGGFVLASNVSAADSTGTYEGTIKCTVYDENGTKFKEKSDLVVLVNQEETIEPVSNLRMSFNFFPGGLADGTQFDDANNPESKASIGAVGCENFGEATVLNFVANAELKNADGNGKAKLKGTASFTDDGENGTCKWKVTRTTIDPPLVPACDD